MNLLLLMMIVMLIALKLIKTLKDLYSQNYLKNQINLKHLLLNHTQKVPPHIQIHLQPSMNHIHHLNLNFHHHIIQVEL